VAASCTLSGSFKIREARASICSNVRSVEFIGQRGCNCPLVSRSSSHSVLLVEDETAGTLTSG
jgi:hypothetical protein